MEFLPEGYEQKTVDYSTLIKVEMLIHNALTDREKYTKRLMTIRWEWEAEKMIKELLEVQPIMGYHSIPHSIEEQRQAIKQAVERDDFYER